MFGLVLVTQNPHCIDFGPGKSGSTVISTDTDFTNLQVPFECHGLRFAWQNMQTMCASVCTNKHCFGYHSMVPSDP